MPNYVYIIQSLSDGCFYRGYSENPTKRLLQHNNKESSFTSTKVPWRLVYVEYCQTKTIALKKRESVEEVFKCTNRKFDLVGKEYCQSI